MNEYDIKRLALVLSVQAEIEGMKCANVERRHLSHADAYDNEAFAEKAEELRILASKHNEEL